MNDMYLIKSKIMYFTGFMENATKSVGMSPYISESKTYTSEEDAKTDLRHIHSKGYTKYHIEEVIDP